MDSNLIERMRNGEIIPTNAPEYTQLHQEFENTMSIVGELNTGYHTPDEVRMLLEHIWGQSLDTSVRMFPPFYTAFGKLTRVGKELFINFGCTFLDQGTLQLKTEFSSPRRAIK